MTRLEHATQLAKLTPPMMSDVYPRARLFARLEKCSEKPIAWISAPGGSGKTTLVASYLQECGRPALWYQIDEGDVDLASFFYYLGQAAAPFAADDAPPMPLFTAEYLGGVTTYTRNFFRQLYARLPPSGVVVFDNYQDAPAEAAIHGALQCGFAEIPRGISVIVISRTDPPPTFARLRASGSLALLDWNDLSLTREESRGIASLRCGNHLMPSDQLNLFHEHSNGWMAGLVLMVEQASQLGAPQLVETQSREVIFDYFAGEIFQRADMDVQTFLMRTSLLTKISVPAAQAISGMRNADRILADLTRRNYFTFRHSLPAMTYEYHPLFREYLLNRAREHFPADAFRELQVSAAALLQEEGDLVEAAALLLNAEEWPALGRLVLGHAADLINQGRGQTLAHWITALPAAARASSPWLLYWLGICRLPFDPTEAREHLVNAFDTFKAEGNVGGLLQAWCGIADTFVFEWADSRPLVRWIGELESIIQDDGVYPSPELEAQVACSMFMALVWSQPDHPQMPEWEKRVWDIVLYGNDMQLRLKVGNHLLIYQTWWRGELHKAHLLLTTLQPILETPGIPLIAVITLHAMVAGYKWMVADNDDAIAHANKGLEIAAQTGIHVWDMLLCCQGVFASLSSGQMQLAENFFRHMDQVFDSRRRMDAAMCYYQRAWYEFLRDDLNVASELVRTSFDLGQDSGNRLFIAVSRNDMARTLFYTGNEDEALREIRIARTEGRSFRANTVEYLTWLSEAELQWRKNDITQCLKSLRACLEVGREMNFRNHTWWDGKTMSRLYALALEHDIETEYVRSVIQQRGLTCDEAAHSDKWPRPVKIYSFGAFRLLLNDQPVQVSGKAQLRPLSLLKALIAFGGQNVPQEQLCDALWPDSEGDAAKRTLHSNIFRARKLLQHEDALVVKEERVSLDPRHCWVDAWALEHGLRATEESSDMAAITRALDLYRGDFLAGEDESWAIDFRERIRAKLVRRLTAVFRGTVKGQDLRAAVRCCERGLEIDPTAEFFYQELMRLYHTQGRRSDAITLYRRCESTLKKQLGHTPSEATRRLYRQINGTPPGN